MVTAKKSPATSSTTTNSSAASKPAASRTTPASDVKKVAASVKTPSAKKSVTNPSSLTDQPVLAISPEQRCHYVEVAAFYIAERRGFAPGNPVDDWCAAEQEVDRLIATGHFTHPNC